MSLADLTPSWCERLEKLLAEIVLEQRDHPSPETDPDLDQVKVWVGLCVLVLRKVTKPRGTL